MLLACGYETVASDWHVNEKSAPLYCRAYYVLSGDVVYRCGSAAQSLRPGYLYVFPSTVPYRMEQDPSHPLKCLYLHLDIFPNLLTELLELKVTEDSFLFHLLNAMILGISAGFLQNLDAGIQQNEIPGSGISAGPGISTGPGISAGPVQDFDPVIAPLSDALIAYLRSHSLLQSVPRELAETIQYISAHISEAISIESLSLLSGYHPQYYIRLFRKHMKMTPHQYIINYRMRVALYALLAGDKVGEAAGKAGYPEIRNFSRAFHKHYGYSPSQIRNFLKVVP